MTASKLLIVAIALTVSNAIPMHNHLVEPLIEGNHVQEAPSETYQDFFHRNQNAYHENRSRLSQFAPIEYRPSTVNNYYDQRPASLRKNYRVNPDQDIGSASNRETLLEHDPTRTNRLEEEYEDDYATDEMEASSSGAAREQPPIERPLWQGQERDTIINNAIISILKKNKKNINVGQLLERYGKNHFDSMLNSKDVGYHNHAMDEILAAYQADVDRYAPEKKSGLFKKLQRLTYQKN